MGFVLLALAGLLAAAGAARAVALDRIVARAYFVDLDGQMTLEQVQQQAFQPYSTPLSRGYTPSVTWLRLDVAPAPEAALVLLVQPPYLDNVRLYSPQADGGWQMQQHGDLFAYADRPRPEVLIAFDIQPAPAAVTRHYLRLVTRTGSLIDTRVMTQAESARFDTNLHALTGVYAGVLIMLFWLGAVRWWITRDALWAASLFLLAATLMLAVMLLGFGAKYIWPHDPALADEVSNLIGVVHLSSIALLFLLMFRAYGAPRWTWAVYAINLALTPVMLGGILLGHSRPMLSINSLLILAQSLWGLVAIWFVPLGDKVQRRLMRVTYLGLAGFGVFFALPLLGILQPTRINLYPGLIVNFYVAVMQYFALLRRSIVAAREAEHAHHQATELSRLLSWEQAKRTETSHFLDMLLHELKAPLGAIRLTTWSLARANEPAIQAARLADIEHAVDAMNTVLERTRETDELESGVVRQYRAPHDIAALVRAAVARTAEPHRVILAGATALHGEVDADLLGLLMKNLLDNALNYSPAESAISVELADAAFGPGKAGFRAFFVRVRNAVDAADKPDPTRLFDKYYRAPSARQRTGTGLGLYWSRGAAALMNGELNYVDEGPAVIFELRLPY